MHRSTTPVVLVALIAILAACRPAEPQVRPSGQSAMVDPVAVPSPFGYPSGWRTTLPDAVASARFTVLVPSDPAANVANLVAVYGSPDGAAVALGFPAPASPKAPVRQDSIEVWEQPWTGKTDPQAFFANDLAALPDSAALYDVRSVMALGVKAHASEDDQQMNPAFLRMDVQGVDVQISGGESLDLLLRIANSIVLSAASATPTPSVSAS